jgi:hypothetical protein
MYNIPLNDMRLFIKENKSSLNEILRDRTLFEYRKIFGKSYYDLEIERFIEFFKIDKDKKYAVQIIKYFTSEKFLENVYKLLNFEQFDLKAIKSRDFLYTLVFYISKQDKNLLEKFFHKLFLHFYTSTNQTTNIHVDYIELSSFIAKNRGLVLKESFGEDAGSSYFQIFGDGKLLAQVEGKSLKTLRKKAYKKLFLELSLS